MTNFWDYNVWGFINLLAVLLMSLLVGNVLKKNIPFLQATLIPTSVIGGVLLIIIADIYKGITGNVMFDVAFFGGNGTDCLEIITYHALALGFIAATLKSSGGKMSKERTVEVINTGITTVSSYLIQAVCGLAISIVAAKVVKDFFPAAGTLLCFGYGQGTGQALNYGNIYETQFGFVGGKSFGLTIAALGFLSAAIGGVIHMNIFRKRGIINTKKAGKEVITEHTIQKRNEIPMQESLDKITIQVAFVFGAYLLTYFIMFGLGKLLPGMKAVIYGFNFLLGVLSAVLIKFVLRMLMLKKIVRKEYLNDFLMTRISNLCYDLMIVAGVAAIRLSALESFWGIILIMGVVGAVVTYAYNRIVAKTLFKDYEQEQFLVMYGMLTGTASTGVILLREIDPDFKTPAADNLVYQNFPAIVLGLPIMLLATVAPEKPVMVMLVCLAYFFVLVAALFRSKWLKIKNPK